MHITRNVIIAGVIIVLFILVAAYLSLQQGSQILPSPYSGPVNVSSVAIEINYANIEQQCFGQSVDVQPGFSSYGNSSQGVLVTVLDSCQEAQSISSIGTDTAGFRVVAANPLLPIRLMQGNKITFNVTISTPASYSGVLDILVNAS